MMDRSVLKQMLIQHEGLRLKPYIDTVGKVTIGVGRNLTDNGISTGEALLLLEHDMDQAIQLLRANIPIYTVLSDVRQLVLTDMGFNLGVKRLQAFKQMLAAIDRSDWAGAKRQMLASKWASQVGYRAIELAEMMETGHL